jgi:hypothetical protein
MVTIVTSLYDIGRSKIDGRSWDNYLEWFKKTLSLNAPFVIFVDESLKKFVEDTRGDKPTKIITEPLENIPYYYLKDRMDLVINSSEYKKFIKDSNRIECRSSLYNCIQYSKFKWMLTASKINFFNSEYFIWMDAGLSRFFSNLDTYATYPGKNAQKILLQNKDKILIQVFESFYPDLFYAVDLTEKYLYDNRSYVMGGMLGAGIKALESINTIIDNMLEEEMLSKNLINNEQIALGFLWKKNPSLFFPFINKKNIHRSYELINQLSY